MDFLPILLTIIAAVLVVAYVAKRNRGTKHVGDLRPDTPEAHVVTSGHAARDPREGRAE